MAKATDLHVDRLLSTKQQLGLQAVFTLLGSVPWQDTPTYLNAMDLFVFPSYREAFGLALVEVMSCGLPPVARISAGAKEIIVGNESGYLVATDDEIFYRVLELAQDKALRKAIGGNARRRVQQQYSWKVAAEVTVDVYREMLCQK